ncbi:MAG TPA: WXG100 family type VII secretion target [Candidatus Eubacterium faecipullorum]|uniref:WXG100 family type VII secretion target n=1 Tax=Candidatus Eubacterium faecipullorum TaxID=2838571 RepID=A0A9D1REK4_9FIRM|nr:WXG100 family type VII secretion target [Candidatus Eubacterium faecipullorum]
MQFIAYININERSEYIVASGQIRMTPESMRSRAAEYSAEGQKLQEIINKMDTLLSQLQSEWEGSASESYAQRYTELKPGFVKARELIEEISTALKSTANIVEETDTNIANQFKA